ncbi:MAG: hypothetical protein ACLQNE_06425 [Thermoguttaceae bacterium]|jgi:intracellular sulfur oxidation DsrE/DsrF family protein
MKKRPLALSASSPFTFVLMMGVVIVLLVQGESKHVDTIQSLIDRKVKFVACRNTLRDKSIAEERRLPGVQVAASGAV